jgi:micrococcal nuclease
MKIICGALQLSVVLFLLQGCSFRAFSNDSSLKVIGVSDGDTIKVLDRGRSKTIRLRGIDCPEKQQAYGKRAKQMAADLVFGKQVRVVKHGSDRYSREIADIVLPDGRVLNQVLVGEGMCWWYRHYAPHDRRLQTLEAESRAARIGLWRDRNPIPPWEFRKQRKERNVAWSWW